MNTQNVQKQTSVAVVLALFVGGVGAHHFYLRRYVLGTIYLLFCWTYIPMIVAWIEILFLKKRVDAFNARCLYTVPAVPEIKNVRKQPTRTISSGRPFQESAPPLEVHPEEASTGPFFLKQLPEHVLNPLVQQTREINRNGLSFTVQISSSHDSFYQESVKNRNKKGKRVAHCSFMTYWPTFSSLSKEQANWYFYWRQEVTNGNYPDTDLSYIFLFAYELMGYAYEPNPDKSVTLLISLYDSYCERHPKLSNYLPEWIGDLFVEGGREDLASDWYAKSNFGYGDLSGLDKYNSSETFAKMPYRIWKKQMRLYRPTKFFESNSNELSQSFKEAIHEANTYYLQSHQKTLIDHWFPKCRVEGDRFFRSAVISSKRANRYRTVHMRQQTDTSLQELDAIIRFTENLIREAHGVKRKIKVEEELIPEGLKERLEQRFVAVIQSEVTKTSSTPFTLDPALIAQLQHDSSVIHEALLYEEPDIESPTHVEEVDIANVPQETHVNVEQEVAAVEENPLGVLMGSGASQEIGDFAVSLLPIEREFLKMFTDEREPIDSCREFTKRNGLLLSQFIDQINEKSLEHLGDNLLEEIGDEYVVTEEFIDVIDEVVYAA